MIKSHNLQQTLSIDRHCNVKVAISSPVRHIYILLGGQAKNMTTQHDPVALLKDGQKECLRLVLHHYSSKVIARQLGISSHTVDQRLRLAVRHLAASDRFEAARILAAAEHGDEPPIPYQPLIYQSSHLPSPDQLGNQEASGDIRDNRFDNQSSGLNDAFTPFVVGQTNGTETLFSNPVSFGEATPTHLGIPAKIAWVVSISTISLLAFSAAIAGLEVLSRL
jgi:DNA-binding CsgD family transcriptional regulator